MKKIVVVLGIVVFFTLTAFSSYIYSWTKIRENKFDAALEECQKENASLQIHHYEEINGRFLQLIQTLFVLS